MLWPTLDVLDTFVAKRAFKSRLTSPRRVLAALVGQDFARAAVLAETASQRFDHERTALVVREGPPRHEAAVIVHETAQIDAFFTSQQEGEDVALPHLVWLRALESTRWLRTTLALGGSGLQQPLLSQHATNGRLRHTQPFETSEDV